MQKSYGQSQNIHANVDTSKATRQNAQG